jgi:curved DNA-binding protein CbpA
MDQIKTKKSDSVPQSEVRGLSRATEHELKSLVAELLRRIATKNHYLVLCLEPNADLTDIKRNYFQLMKKFHPDRTSAALLGISSEEQYNIVRTISTAYGVLSSPEKRRAYHQQRSLPAPGNAVGSQKAKRPMSSAASRLRQARGTEPSHSARANATTGQTNAPSITPPRLDPAIALSAAVRLRENRKSSRVPLQNFSDRGSSSPSPQMKNRSSSLLSKHPSMMPSNEPSQHYVQLMEEAAAAKQWSSAASLGKMALQMNPENPAVVSRQRDYQTLADQELAPQYQEQAHQAKSHRDYARAATLFERAANGLQSAELYAHAAENLKKQEHPARKLVELCRNAARLAPDSINYKLALADAYIAAGSKNSAKTILAQAQILDRKNPYLKELARKIKA